MESDSRALVDDDELGVLLADDLIDSDEPVIRQMAGLYEKSHCSILGVQNIELAETINYGIIECEGEEMWPLIITSIVEKPKPENAPSTLGVVGRYIFTPEIFSHLERVKPGVGGEIQLTDGIVLS